MKEESITPSNQKRTFEPERKIQRVYFFFSSFLFWKRKKIYWNRQHRFDRWSPKWRGAWSETMVVARVTLQPPKGGRFKEVPSSRWPLKIRFGVPFYWSSDNNHLGGLPTPIFFFSFQLRAKIDSLFLTAKKKKMASFFFANRRPKNRDPCWLYHPIVKEDTATAIL